MKKIDNIVDREDILEGYWDKDSYNDKWPGGTRLFENVPLSVLEELVGMRFLDLEECQNDSPTTKEFMGFMQKWDKPSIQVRAHGYVVSSERPDSRITVEGLQILLNEGQQEILDPRFIKAWWSFNKDADELTETWSWWD